MSAVTEACAAVLPSDPESDRHESMCGVTVHQELGSVRRAAGLLLALSLVLAALVVPRVGAHGQEVMRIAAVVNDEVISIYDLVARIDIIIATTNLKDTPELRRQIAPQVLRNLIDERLQMQEAQKLGITVDESEIQAAVAQVEQRNHLSKGGLERFISARRLDHDAVFDQLRAEIAWTKVVRQRLGGTISVGEDEIDEALARLEANKGQPEYRVAEIFLNVESPDVESEVLRTAQNLIDQMHQGAAFSVVARQFSQSATAAVGGDIGWVIKGQLPSELDEALEKIRPGQITPPIRTFEGYYILMLVDRRTLLSGDPGEAHVHLAQVVVDEPKNDAAAQRALLQPAVADADSCDALLKDAQPFASPLSGDLGTLKLGDLPADIRNVIEPLGAGQVSEPQPYEQGLRVFMVCEREEASSQLPDRDTIRRDLANRRLELQARRYLRDLRRTAFVDFRI